MRPIPIPVSIRQEWAGAGASFAVFSAPSGDLTDPEVRPIEAAIYYGPVLGEGEEIARTDQAMTSVVLQLEPGDLEALAVTNMMILTVWGHGFPVFQIQQVVPLEEAS